MAKKTTVKDIANKLGISSSTVSFVLNNKEQGISEETRQKVIETAIEMNYRKVPKANMLGWLRVAYLTPNIQYFNFYTSFYAEVYSHLQSKATDNKIDLSLREFDISASIEKKYLELQKLQNLDIDVYITHSHECAEYLAEHGLKVILSQGGQSSKCLNIYCDDYGAGKLAAEYAYKMGHRIAGMIFPIGGARYQGFLETFERLGGACPEQFRWAPKFEHDEIENFVKDNSICENLPSIFYCFADNVMFPAIRGFATNNLKIPENVSLIGTDNLYWGKYAQPAFTTIDLCEKLFADKLIEAVFHVSQNKEAYNLAVPVRLIERETVKNIC